jgi:UDP-glucose 4-epimerase
MRIVLTGAAGFIGSHTLVVLQELGHDVVAIDDFSNSESHIPARIQEITGQKAEWMELDVAKPGALKQALENGPAVDGIIHFAAFKAVEESVNHPLKYYRNNLYGLVEVLDCMRELSIRNLVFSSSCTVYGNPEHLPVDESAPFRPAVSPYGETKQMGERILQDSLKAYPELRACILRYFNPIGAHPSGLIGELCRGVPSNLIPYITQTAIGKRERLRIFGNDYSTADGTCIRDFIHVCDLADAHVRALDYVNRTDQNPCIFNVGTGKGVSVQEAVDTFNSIWGKPLPVEYAPRRAGDVEKIWSDTQKIEQELGWTAQRSLADALQDAWRWEQNLAKDR